MTVKEREEKAAALFCSGFNCAQSVFAAFCDITGFEEKAALRISSSFGGGVARHRDICGAVSAGAMVLGVLYGHDEPNRDLCAEHYKRVSDFLNAFEEENGSVICRDLLAINEEKAKNDKNDPVPTERNADFYKDRPCVYLVKSAVRLLCEMIDC